MFFFQKSCVSNKTVLKLFEIKDVKDQIYTYLVSLMKMRPLRKKLWFLKEALSLWGIMQWAGATQWGLIRGEVGI